MTRISRGTKLKLDWATHERVKAYIQHPKKWYQWMERKRDEFKAAEEGWEAAEAGYYQARTTLEATIPYPVEGDEAKLQREEDPDPILDHVIYRSNYQRVVQTRVGKIIQRTIRGLSKEQHRKLWGKARLWKQQAAKVQFARMELINGEPFCYPTPESKEAHIHRTKVAKTSATEAYKIQIGHGNKGWSIESRPSEESLPEFKDQKDQSEVFQNDQTLSNQTQPSIRSKAFKAIHAGVKSLVPNSMSNSCGPSTTTTEAARNGLQGMLQNISSGGRSDNQTSVATQNSGVAESSSVATLSAAPPSTAAPSAAAPNTVKLPLPSKHLTKADKAAVSRRNQEDAKLRMARENVAAAAAAEEARKAKAATKTDKHGKSKSPPKNNSKSGKFTKLSPPSQVTKKGKGKEKAVPKNCRGKR